MFCPVAKPSLTPIARAVFEVCGAGASAPAIYPLFSRPFSTTASLGASPTFARGSNATFIDHEGVIRTVPNNCARFEGARYVRNLFTNTTTSLSSGSSTTAVSVGVGTYVFSMGVGSGTATFSGTATGSTGTLNANASARTAKTLTITVAGTIIVTASVADLATIQLENWTGRSDVDKPSEYVSVGIESAPYHGAGVDGVKFFTTENGNSVDDGTQGEPELVTNGDFDTDTDWTKETGWTISGGKAIATASPKFQNIHQMFALVAGDTYVVSFELEINTNSVDVFLGTGGSGDGLLGTFSASGRYSVKKTFVSGQTQQVMFMSQGGAFTGTVDNVSVVEYIAANDTGIVTEATGATISPAPYQFVEINSATNRLINSSTPATQTTASLATGDYILWVEGAGSAAVTAGTATITGGGTASDGTPDLFTVTGAGTVTVTVTGSLDRFQLEGGSVKTSYISTAGSPLARAADTLSYSGAWTADNETRAVENGTDVDVDDWDGVVDSTLDSDADGILKLSSITVYTTGGRPA